MGCSFAVFDPPTPRGTIQCEGRGLLTVSRWTQSAEGTTTHQSARSNHASSWAPAFPAHFISPSCLPSCVCRFVESPEVSATLALTIPSAVSPSLWTARTSGFFRARGHDGGINGARVSGTWDATEEQPPVWCPGFHTS